MHHEGHEDHKGFLGQAGNRCRTPGTRNASSNSAFVYFVLVVVQIQIRHEAHKDVGASAWGRHRAPDVLGLLHDRYFEYFLSCVVRI
jgi:hypothetical protein